MANPFQSGPSFGNLYATGPYYPHYQQYGGQQPAPSPSSYPTQATPLHGYQAGPSANLGRFDLNNQMPSQKFPFPPSAFNPDVFKSFSSPPISLFPPTSFPPVPLPQNGTSPLYQHVPHGATPIYNAPVLSDEDPDSYDPRYPQSIGPSKPQDKQAHTTFTSLIHSAQQQQHADERNPYAHIFSQQDQEPTKNTNSNEMTRSFNLDGPALPVQTGPALSAATSIFAQPQTQSRHINMASEAWSPASLAPSQHSFNASLLLAPKSSNPFQQRNDVLAPQQQSIRTFQRHYENKSAFELRQLAKGALLSLAPHNIHYSDLIKEGINSTILEQLYEELGIKVAPQGISPKLGDLDATQIEPVASPPTQAVSIAEPQPQVPSFKSQALADRPSPAVSPGLERKDRIAQLLAAKVGRPSPVQSTSESGASPAPRETTPHLTAAGTGNRDVGSPSAASITSNAVAATRTESPHQDLEKSMEPIHDMARGHSDLGAKLSKNEPVLSPFSSSIPGLFMTAHDPLKVDVMQVDDISQQHQQQEQQQEEQQLAQYSVSVSQKRQRSSTEDDHQNDHISKRQNTILDAEEGETMDLDSPSRDDDADAEPRIDDFGHSGQRDVSGAVRATTGQESENLLGAAEPLAGATTGTSSAGAVLASQSRAFNSTPSARMTAAQITERAEMLKARFLKQRAERQKALQEGLPNLDAEVRRTEVLLTEKKARLRQIEEEIERLRDAMTEAERARHAAVDDVSRLERQLQESMSGQRQYSDELQKLNTEQKNSPAPSQPKAVPESVRVAAAAQAGQDLIQVRETAEIGITQKPPRAASFSSGATDNNSEAAVSRSKAEIEVHLDETHAQPVSPSADQTLDEQGLNTRSDHGDSDDGRSGESHHDDSQLASFRGSRTSSAEPLQVSESVSEQNRKSLGGHPPDGHDSDGSASMSDSGSETDEYEPADPGMAFNTNIDDNASDEYDPEEAPVTATPASGVLIGDDEDYKTFKETKTRELEVTQETETAVEAHATPNNNGIDPGAQTQPTTTSASLASRSPSAPPVNGVKRSPAEGRARSSVTPLQALLNQASDGSNHFVPYQSPLSNYKSFRYNQQFNDTAKHGYRSLTYSNTIDPNVPLCQTELAGGVCQNPSCEDQHFRKLQLSDEQILVQMSSGSDIKDKQIRDRFTQGLKELIADLRVRNVKEFENVANELSDYRRRFFADQNT